MHNSKNIKNSSSKIHSYTKKLCSTQEYSIFVKCMVSNYSKGIYCQRVYRKEALITPTEQRAKLRQWGTKHTTGGGRGISVCFYTASNDRITHYSFLTWPFLHSLHKKNNACWRCPYLILFFSTLLHLWPFCTLLILLWRVIYFHMGFSEVPLSKPLDCFGKK